MGKGPEVKFAPYIQQLVYAASPKMLTQPLQPGDTTLQISHECLQTGCSGEGADAPDTASHLRLETPLANQQRKNCTGVVVVVASIGGKRCIVLTKPCRHGISGRPDPLEGSCRRVQVVDMGDMSELAVRVAKAQAALEAALAEARQSPAGRAHAAAGGPALALGSSARHLVFE